MIPEQRDPLDLAWQCVADAAIEGDREHELRALAELARLLDLREPRP